ncbi:MAG TPA: archaetidylserine decarboxylase [Steroidobacteraceae bacterium]|jgi:phosphatidylserine decarboxylase|nr:archaetidylserine decarboxylase [Steroidobacteraceae bacterium]
MNAKSLIARVTQQEDINFLISNRIPRRLVTRFVGWLSRIENPWVCRISIALWTLFSDLDLSESKTQRFKSLHECFTRELKEGSRPIDREPANLISPCDGLVGACGTISLGMVVQAKGFPYSPAELLADPDLARHYEGGRYATLRLTSSMYHRFHAPADCRVEQVNYISGDAWNVNPAALKRVERLYCRNERAVIRCRLASGALLTLVPVAAILVASIRLRFLDVLLHLRYRGPNVIPCDAILQRGEEMGWFEHGSTIIVLAPPGIRLGEGILQGARVKMGQALLRIG